MAANTSRGGKASGKKSGGNRKSTRAPKSPRGRATIGRAATKRAGSRARPSASRTRQGAGSTRPTTANRSRGAGARSAARSTARGGDLSQAQMTTDHDEIRRWVEERGGYPATVIGTGEDGEEAGVLRIDYPGYSGQGTLERISWDEFFQKFDEADLVFLYQEETKKGGPSRFSKLAARSEQMGE